MDDASIEYVEEQFQVRDVVSIELPMILTVKVHTTVVHSLEHSMRSNVVMNIASYHEEWLQKLYHLIGHFTLI